MRRATFSETRRMDRELDMGHWRMYERKLNRVGSTLCSILFPCLSRHWRRWDGDPSAAWDRQSFPFLVQNQKDRSRKAAERVMVSIISCIQANLQHGIAASRVLTRTVAVKGIDMTLIQESCYREGRIKPKYSSYTLFCVSAIDRPRACILATRMNV